MNHKVKRDCFCALCRSPRKLRYSRHLQSIHYGQILVLTLVVASVTYPWLVWKGALSLPLIWAIFESTHKSLYRKDSQCPYCGFDPLWYKKDVKLARKKVEDFLKQNPESPVFKRSRSTDQTPAQFL